MRLAHRLDWQSGPKPLGSGRKQFASNWNLAGFSTISDLPRLDSTLLLLLPRSVGQSLSTGKASIHRPHSSAVVPAAVASPCSVPLSLVLAPCPCQGKSASHPSFACAAQPELQIAASGREQGLARRRRCLSAQVKRG